MKYRIIGTTIPAVEIKFDAPGETMYTQSGGMSWMSEGISMSTNTRGGFMKGLGRMFAGESMSTVPGQVLPIDAAENGGMICQKGAFLCAQDSVNLDVTFTKKFTSGLFGGEGFILESISGSGMAFLEIDGDVVEKQLAPGEVIKVDTGNIVAFEKTLKYEVETIKGLGNIFFGGEGLFLTKLTGPGRVILQTQNIADFAGRIAQFIPTKSN